MRLKIMSIGLAVFLLMVSFNMVLADRPAPGALPPGKPEVHPTPHADGKDKGDLRQEAIGDKRRGIFGTVKSKSGNTLLVAAKDGDVTVIVTATTKIHIPTKRNATIADIAVGDRVTVNGMPTTNGLVAKQIAVTPGKPTITHRVGKVTAYTQGSSITIQDEKGKSYMFTLTAQTEIRNPKGIGVAVEDQVTIVARRDPSADTFTATAIVVHPQDEDNN